MKNTDFLKLNMPELTDKADVLKLSEDMDWLDSAIKTLNEFHASVEQRLTRLELKGETTDAGINSIRSDISGLIRQFDGLITRINSIESIQTDTARRINTLSDKQTADMSELTGKIVALDARLVQLSQAYLGEMRIVNEEIAKFNGYFKPVSI